VLLLHYVSSSDVTAACFLCRVYSNVFGDGIKKKGILTTFAGPQSIQFLLVRLVYVKCMVIILALRTIVRRAFGMQRFQSDEQNFM